MRLFLAWLLLTTTTLQWVGGLVCFKVIYSIQVEARMNDTEKTVAKSIKATTGMDANVKVIDSDQLDIKSIGYSNFFLFSEEIENETVYYTINAYPIDWVDYEYTPDSIPLENGKNKMASFERFFSNFLVHKVGFPIFTTHAAWQSDNFSSRNLSDLFFSPILVPPPEIV